MNYKDKSFEELTKDEKEIVDKKIKINMLVVACNDYLVHKFFDTDSDEMLDLKIDILTKMSNGKQNEISNKDFYKILELYPKNEDIIWD